jgi:hypothetical protein
MAPNDTHDEEQPPVEAAPAMSLREKSERAAFIRMMYSPADLQLALSAVTFLSECEWGKPISKVELRRYKCYETTALIAYALAFCEKQRWASSHFPNVRLLSI